jgi:hypothetical protein
MGKKEKKHVSLWVDEGIFFVKKKNEGKGKKSGKKTKKSSFLT